MPNELAVRGKSTQALEHKTQLEDLAPGLGKKWLFVPILALVLQLGKSLSSSRGILWNQNKGVESWLKVLLIVASGMILAVTDVTDFFD